MKKVLISVLVVMLLIGVAGAAAGYYFIYRPAKAYVANLAQLQEIPKLDAQVRNKAAFTAPAGGELTEERVKRFLSTQQAVQAQLGSRIEQIEEKYQTITTSRAGQPEREVSLPEALRLLKDLSGLVVEAKRAQVEALNQHNFSLPEYEWTRSQVYAAAGIPVDAYFTHIMREVAAGREPSFQNDGVVLQVPDKNRELVKPFVTELGDRAGLVFFGL